MSKKPSLLSIETAHGSPSPLGPTLSVDFLNVAIHVKGANGVTLALFRGDERVVSVPMQRTGSVWHVKVSGDWDGCSYGVEVERDGHSMELLDPYARLVEGPAKWGEQVAYRPRSRLIHSSFDWQSVSRPNHKTEDLILYELHLRGFTADPSSGVENRGTYRGLIEKIPYLQSLGVNAIELLPCMEFWEGEYTVPLCNFWGYSTVNFFSPMSRYASDPANAIDEFKEMVRECHRAGIEVILDVVYNHTAESDANGPTYSFRGLDPDYYLYDANGDLANYSGCGNTLNCNHPLVQDLIVDSLRYWAVEMGVDGFRFDLASILGRGSDGEPLTFAPVIDRISHDPILADTKLIAEAWDAAGLYQVGNFYPQYACWSEWNGRYRDVIRRFLRGDSGQAGPFATAICGSQDLYHGRSPLCSVNFITAHDGFSLRDLVSYNEKHNEENREENRDGANDNESWNCGVEGGSDDPGIIAIRERQIRNFLTALLLSKGVPMLSMGDEYGHSKKGNNNTWCQDNRLSWFQWDTLEQNRALFSFVQKIIALRKKTPELLDDRFFNEGDLSWHDRNPEQPDWSEGSHLVGWTFRRSQVTILFSSDSSPFPVTLPVPAEGHHWCDAFSGEPYGETTTLPPYSSLVLVSKPLAS